MTSKIKFAALLYLVGLFLSYSQELPPIETYLPKDYGAEDQVWGIAQGDDKTIYFANNEGLLSYNGAKWTLYESPNSSIIRSVKVVDDKIFTGCYMDFGFWEKDDKGFLNYTSIAKQKNIKLLEDEEFWNILKLDHWLVFQSLDRIYIYDTIQDSFRIIDSNTTITKVYKVDEDIYFQKLNEGIYKLEKGNEVLVTNNQEIIHSNIINISRKDNGLLFLTKAKGFYTMADESTAVSQWDAALNKELSKYIVYNSIELLNGDFILGTIANGIVYVSSNKDIPFKINQSMGLGNNTVLSLFEDESGNVWLGLNHGISNINLKSSFRFYKDDLGVLGAIYDALIEDNFLYVGTNQGLFYKDVSKNEPFKLVQNTDGQVWYLGKLQNTIFCGHDAGTFVVNQGNARKISEINGTWNIKEIEENPNLLVQGNYNGLFILEKVNNQWRYRNKLEGFDISSRFLEFIAPNKLLVSHEYKGVYILETDENYTKIINYSTSPIHKSVKSSLAKLDSVVLYGTHKGVYAYNSTQNKFEKNSVLSKLFPEEGYSSGKIINVNDKLFAFNKNSISYAEKSKLSTNIKISQIPLPNVIRETKDGYENILYLGNKEYLIGTTVGYIISRLDDDNYAVDQSLSLNNISVSTLKGDSRFLKLIDSPTLKNKENNLQFSFSINDYSKYLPSQYQYRLLDFNDIWSNWSNNPTAYFENLPHGEYTFEVRAKLGNTLSVPVQYSFIIEKPFYLSPIAMAIYIFLGLVLVVIIHMVNRIYYKKKHRKELEEKEKEIKVKQLENERQRIHYKNLDLQKDIELKNRELSLTTMNLIKRNDLLNDIKKELNSDQDNSKVINLINKNLNDTDDWKLFEKAFNNIDKDFIKKLKSIHPNLTSNDIRLCTYLRLNLSSKEIAPLFNISFRSVEVKRYRLRKKMNLPHEESLSNYILHL